MASINLKDFGATGDGVFDNSAAFKAAFAAAAGGTLTVSAGTWLTGPIDIPSDTELHLESGAIIKFIADPNIYKPVFTRWEGVECYAMHPCVLATKAKNIQITGKGTIEGNGKPWWDLRQAKRSQKVPQDAYELELAKLNPGYENQPGGGGGRNCQFLRPSLVEFFECENVRIEGITIQNSPFWTVHPCYCKGVVLDGVSIINPATAPNTDGIDIDSCTDVRIENCLVSVGDDGICLKSGSGPDGIKKGLPTSNVYVKNCTVKDAHGGIVIGSETAAGINNVVAEDCSFPQTDRGIRIKSRRGRGGDIYGITLKNLKMEDNKCPIAVNMYYKCGETDPNSPLFSLEKQPVTAETPRIHDVHISGVHATGCKASAGLIVGLPESPIDNLTITDCSFSTDESSTESPMDSDMFFGLPEVTVKSFRIRNAPGAKFENVTIQGPKDVFIYE